MERVALIDGDEIAYKGAFACQNSYYEVFRDQIRWKCKNKQDAVESIESEQGFQIEKRVDSKDINLGYKRIDALISAILYNTSCSLFMIYLSGDNNFRKQLATLQEYKGNRKEKPVNLEKMKDYLMGKKAISVSYLEADDLLSSTQNDLQGYETVICTQDKDLKTVPGLNYNISTKKLINIGEDEARYNFYTQLLLGDTVDNIPHPTGLGKQFAKKLLDPLLESDAGEIEYYETVKEAYVLKLNADKTKWYEEGMDVDKILWEIGNLLYMHRTRDENERWEIPK